MVDLTGTSPVALALACGVGIGIGIGATVALGLHCPSQPAAATCKTGTRAPPTAADQELMKEQLSRNTLFFGERGQQKLAGAFVVVVGLGGVGSHCAHMLARSGIGRLRLVDFDQVSLSSLNRHAVATHADVGRPKASSLARQQVDSCTHKPTRVWCFCQSVCGSHWFLSICVWQPLVL